VYEVLLSRPVPDCIVTEGAPDTPYCIDPVGPLVITPPIRVSACSAVVGGCMGWLYFCCAQEVMMRARKPIAKTNKGLFID
jgi:hypothetical protein